MKGDQKGVGGERGAAEKIRGGGWENETQGRTVGRAAEEPDKAKDEQRYEMARGCAKSAFPHTLRYAS